MLKKSALIIFVLLSANIYSEDTVSILIKNEWMFRSTKLKFDINKVAIHIEGWKDPDEDYSNDYACDDGIVTLNIGPNTHKYKLIGNGKDNLLIIKPYSFYQYGYKYYLLDLENGDVFYSNFLLEDPEKDTIIPGGIDFKISELGKKVIFTDRVYIREFPTKDSRYYEFYDNYGKVKSAFINEFPKESNYSFIVEGRTFKKYTIGKDTNYWYFVSFRPPYSDGLLNFPINVGGQRVKSDLWGAGNPMPYYGWVFGSFIAFSNESGK